MANTMPDSGSPGARLVTQVPSPRRTSSTLIWVSAHRLRSDPRDTPRRSASSFSGGRRSPGLSSPDRTIARMLSIAFEVTLTTNLQRFGRLRPTPARAPGYDSRISQNVGWFPQTGTGWNKEPRV